MKRSRHQHTTPGGMNRRDFVRLGAAAGVGAGMVALDRAAFAAVPDELGPAPEMPFAAPPIENVRIGYVGVGGMGSHHARYLQAGEVKRAEITAVCDIDEDKLKNWSGLETFDDSAQLIRSGLVDAVIVATPHYDHTTIGIDAMQQGLHLLTEKPISVHKADCERLIAAHTANPKLIAESGQGKAIERAVSRFLSMTKAERVSPEILNASRKRRIAAGSGTSIQQINRLLNQFEASKKMMRQFAGTKPKKGSKRMQFPF